VKVSVVISLFNKAEFVGQCIESVLAQTYKEVEVIVVNDGSTDTSYEVAKQYPVRLLNLSNRGQSGARNAGVLVSSGEAILPLDADDWISPEYLAKTVPLMLGGVGIVSTDMKIFGLTTGYVPAKVLTIKEEVAYNEIPVCSLIRREAFAESGGYTSKVDGYEDWNLWIDILKRGWKMAIVNEPLFHYRFLGNAANFRAEQKRNELIATIRELHKDIV
jgi:glycosyltransferase involved in cell wall biosynthesis